MSTTAETGLAPDQAIRAGSKSFAMASRLLAPATRPLVWDLYAWCRHCDDVTDGQVSGHGRFTVEDRTARVEALRRLSDRALAGDVSGGPAFAGLARVVAATKLPRRYVHDHLAGFDMDAAGRRYEGFDDTLSYCYHVAGAVGLMMAWIMGVRDEDTLLRGCDLGMGLQLTNIARDVNDDVVSGRVYLPEAWLREAGVTLVPGEAMAAAARQAVVPVVKRLLDEADRYYVSASDGIRALPWRSAWSVATARLVYAEIGHEVRRRGASAWDARVSTTRAQKLSRLLQALGDAVSAVTLHRRVARAPRLGLWTPPSTAVRGLAS
jgi:15-cis-phytoene synthase